MDQGKVGIGVDGCPGKVCSSSLEGNEDLNSTGKVRIEGREWMNVVVKSVNLKTNWKNGGKEMGRKLTPL